MGDLSAYLNAQNLAIGDVKLRPEWLGHLLHLIDAGTISGKMAKDVFQQMMRRGIDPAELVKEGGLRQIVDDGALEQIAQQVIAANPQSVDAYAKGKTNALMFLVGQAMKHTQGKASPQHMTDMLKRKLEKITPTRNAVDEREVRS
jgi:aspartyl-tRNA(Asn)/glutamyl-tRNA(Gln) amidotransferase subunit B